MNFMKYNIKLFPAFSGLLHKAIITKRHRLRHHAKRQDEPSGDNEPLGSEPLDRISIAAEFTNLSKFGSFYLSGNSYVYTYEICLICQMQEPDEPFGNTGCRSPPTVLIFPQKNQNGG